MIKLSSCIFLLATSALLGCASCARKPDSWKGPIELPDDLLPGAVVARVNGFEIERGDLQRASRWAAHITRSDATQRQLQRVAMRDLLLPRAAIASQDPEGRTVALERARVVRETLKSGMPGPQPPATGEVEIVRSGDISTFGPFVLGAALELEPGEWSDPVEGLGLYHLVRLVELPVEGSAPSITLGVIDFTYYNLAQNLDDLLSESALEIVDPAMHEIIPAALRHRMTPKDEASEASK